MKKIMLTSPALTVAKNLSAAIFLAVSLSVTTTSARSAAGNEGGGGGDVVLIDGKYYLLDMVEAGVEENPYIDTTLTPNPLFVERLKKSLPAGFPNKLIAQKLTEIEKVNRVMARVLMKSIEIFQWKIVNSALLNIVDENTGLQIPTGNMKQLAARKDSSIFIDRFIWSKITDAHKTALVFHEILYALDVPRNAGWDIAKGYPSKFQKSEVARELNGYLFSEFPARGHEGMTRFNDYWLLYSFSNQTNSPGLKEDGSNLYISPHIQLTVNDDYNIVRNMGINLSTSSQSIKKQILDTCQASAGKSIFVYINLHPGIKMRVGGSTFYYSMTGKRTYADIGQPEVMKLEYLTKFVPSDMASCITSLSHDVQVALKDMRAEYGN